MEIRRAQNQHPWARAIFPFSTPGIRLSTLLVSSPAINKVQKGVVSVQENVPPNVGKSGLIENHSPSSPSPTPRIAQKLLNPNCYTNTSRNRKTLQWSPTVYIERKIRTELERKKEGGKNENLLENPSPYLSWEKSLAVLMCDLESQTLR